MLLYAVEGGTFAAEARSLLTRPEDEIVTSAYVWLELTGPVAWRLSPEVRGTYLALRTRFDAWEARNETWIPEQARRLSASHRLKAMDALHAACALAEGCDAFASADGDFARVPGIAYLPPTAW